MLMGRKSKGKDGRMEDKSNEQRLRKIEQCEGGNGVNWEVKEGWSRISYWINRASIPFVHTICISRDASRRLVNRASSQ